MGVTMLWQLLKAEEVVEHYKGADPQDLSAMVAAVDGKALAIDLSTWIVQAGAGQSCQSCQCLWCCVDAGCLPGMVL
jgi:hypothetical protein